MGKQHLPGYSTAFKDAAWETRDSTHYRFCFFKDSLAEKEIERIIIVQEEYFRKILQFLGLAAPEKKIFYYLYPDSRTKEQLMGSPWFAQSIYEDFSIHALYTEKDRVIGPHEDTHLLSLPWGLSIGFLQEGLAEWMVGHAWDGKPHMEYVRGGMEKNVYPPIATFMRHEAWLETSDERAIYFYSLAGAFAAYLISTFGRPKFEELYKRTNRKLSGEQNKNIFNAVYRKDISIAETDFTDTFF